MREMLLDACRFDWSSISPAIFGALFQSVMDPRERRAQGAHYTTEKNILKVIEPLFLDDLRAEFENLRRRRRGRDGALRQFQAKLGDLTFFDPACGCGNFLIIAYRELRQLEIEVLKEIHPRDWQGRRQVETFAETLSAVDVHQFHGIEIGEFPARIAETALWMMDHIMNNRLSLEFGQTYVRIPLEKSPHIVHGDALEIDWSNVLPPAKCSYLFGNPPFGGFVMRDTVKQAQTKAVMAKLGAGGSRLDYVAAWFLKAGAYFSNKSARIAFVATNSITQGEQVAQLWPALFDKYGLEITLGHRTFPWGSDARGMAHVHVVIVGLADRATAPSRRRLFLYDDPTGEPSEIEPKHIGPYLQDAGRLTDRHLVIARQRRSISGLPKIGVGTKPVDGGHYILDQTERDVLLDCEPDAANLIRPFLGGREYINGLKRWLLCVTGVSPSLLRSMPHVMERIQRVRAYREKEGGKLARSLANQPTAFHVTVLPSSDFLVIPEVSSERREYVPVGYLKPPAVPSNQLLVVENATLPIFGLIISAMHMAWLRHVGGRLKSDFRYSSGLVYNTFPLPPENADLTKLEPLAQAVLEARAAHSDST
ncbi:MAG: class I SAM-dependent DNA methyltransferase, partial [Gammaproteobacteria bacterium]|nr:class I SAM-dependent DNA methyltransferase [Gammaproteobacteria bacterium]